MKKYLYTGDLVHFFLMLFPLLPNVEGGYVFTPVCLFLHWIFQKVVDGFAQNLVGMLGV